MFQTTMLCIFLNLPRECRHDDCVSMTVLRGLMCLCVTTKKLDHAPIDKEKLW